MNFCDFLPVAIEASLKAGEEIMRIYNNEECQIKQKEDSSPVTQADLRSSEIICDCLRTFNFPVITEEIEIPPYEVRKNWQHYWLVDPLDGTKEFISRNGEFTVNIALISNNIPVLGIIYVPVTDTLYYAVKGEKAFKLKNAASFELSEIIRKAQKLESVSTREKPVVVTSRSHLNCDAENFIRKLKVKFGDISCVTSGSSVKLCLLAEGVADIYPRYGTTMEWDTASGQVIAGEYGFKLLSSQCSELQYNKPDLRNPGFIAYNPSAFNLEDIL